MSRPANGHGGKREGAGRKRIVDRSWIVFTCEHVARDFQKKVTTRRALEQYMKAADDVKRGADPWKTLAGLRKSLQNASKYSRGDVMKEAARRLKVSVSTVRRHCKQLDFD